VDVFISDDISVPETFGFRTPVVVLPHTALRWPAERLRIVLLHEFIHVKRHDWAIHLLARLSVSLFWFNPLSWYALTRLQHERETACDDDVLRFGVAHSEYAQELVAIAKAWRAASPAVAVAMARSAHLEARIRAILNPHVNRRRLTMKLKLLTLIPAVLVITMASLLTAPAQTGTARVGGIVKDASGARIPDAEVMIAKGASVETVRSSAEGTFEFSGIPDGTYSLKVMVPGFKALEIPDVVAKATPAFLNLTLEIGTISERITITAQGQRRGQPPISSTALQQAPASTPRTTSFASVVSEPPPPTSGPQRLRVGGSIRPARLLNSPKPEYPAYLIAEGVEGTVILDAIIGTGGQIVNLKPKNSQVHADLMHAAVEAVKQWRYEPTLLNGQPIEVITTVTFDFRLKQ
jgi:TonB family protein